METDVNPRPPLRLEGFLPYRLVVLATTVSEAFSSLYSARFGLGIPEWRVLATLGQFGRALGRDIAAHGRMHKTTVSRAAAQLVEAGLVRREPSRRDQREAYLSLTAKGRKVYEEVAPTALAFSARLLDGLSAGDRAALDRILLHLTARADAVAADIRAEIEP
jgi:DNA-binding MarR family transcriptional regulator